MSRARRASHGSFTRLGAYLSTVLLAVFVVGLTAVPASAAIACVYTGATDTLDVTMTLATEDVTLSLGGTGGDKVLVNGALVFRQPDVIQFHGRLLSTLL